MVCWEKVMNHCEICNVDVGEGRQLWGEHVKGKKHQRRLKLSAEEKNGDESKVEPDPRGREQNIQAETARQ